MQQEKRAKERRLLNKQLKDKELKHKKEERACKAAMKEAKFLENNLTSKHGQERVSTQAAAVCLMSQQIT